MTNRTLILGIPPYLYIYIYIFPSHRYATSSFNNMNYIFLISCTENESSSSSICRHLQGNRNDIAPIAAFHNWRSKREPRRDNVKEEAKKVKSLQLPLTDSSLQNHIYNQRHQLNPTPSHLNRNQICTVLVRDNQPLPDPSKLQHDPKIVWKVSC